MRKAFLFLGVITLFLASCTSLFAVNSPAKENKMDTNTKTLTVDEFLDLKSKDIKAMNNGKLTLKDRVLFGLTKRMIKKAKKKEKSTGYAQNLGRKKFKINWQAFILGGVILGILILLATVSPFAFLVFLLIALTSMLFFDRNENISALIGFYAFAIIPSIIYFFKILNRE